MKLSRDVLLAIGLVVILTLITAVSLYQEAKDEITPPILASFSSEPNGSKALFLWLTELNYQVDNSSQSEFKIPNNTDVVLILEPTQAILETDWQKIDTWINNGGTLLLVGNQVYSNLGFSHFEFTTSGPINEASFLQTPLLNSPPQISLEQIRTRSHFSSERSDFVTYLAKEGNPIVVSFEQGNGQVFLATTPFLFSNEGLKLTGNPELALNLISAAGRAGRIWFNEWHHGQRGATTEPLGPAAWLRQTPSGRAIMYAAIILLIALLLQGRAFGRPVPLPDDTSRRGPIAYITAMANLNRRAGHRTAVLQDYHQRLKRHLGQRYRLDPTLPDDKFVAQLAEYNPNLEQEALITLLQQLSSKKVSEHDMVQIASQTAEWLK